MDDYQVIDSNSVTLGLTGTFFTRVSGTISTPGDNETLRQCFTEGLKQWRHRLESADTVIEIFNEHDLELSLNGETTLPAGSFEASFCKSCITKVSSSYTAH